MKKSDADRLEGAERELMRINFPGTKLPADEFVRVALNNAGVTREQLEPLARWLDRHETSDTSEARAVLRRMVGFACSPFLKQPPTDFRRLRWACSLREMAALHTNVLEWFALACIVAAAEHPEAFPPSAEASGRQGPASKQSGAVRGRRGGYSEIVKDT